MPDPTSAESIVAVIGGPSYALSDGHLIVTATEIAAEGDRLRFLIEASIDGTPVEVSNPCYLVEPPLYVPDGGTTTEIDDLTGEAVDVPTFRRDELAAFEHMLRLIVESAARDQT